MDIAICDDDKVFRDMIERHFINYFQERKVPFRIVQFACGEDLIAYPTVFDLIVLDVEMDKLNGIETGKKLNEKNPDNVIFVVTSYDGYLDDSFKIRAFRFLPKPVDFLRLNKALDDALQYVNEKMITFYDVSTGADIRLCTKDIIYIEVSNKNAKMVTRQGTYITKEKISYWKEKLGGISFVCPHSSYLVNLTYSITHNRTVLVLAKRDRAGFIAETFEISIAPKKQAEIKRYFFYVFERT